MLFHCICKENAPNEYKIFYSAVIKETYLTLSKL